VLLVRGERADAEAKRDQAGAVLAHMGLRPSPDKTRIVHIDEGFDFLGWRIQRHRKRGTDRSYVYTYPSKKALKAVMGKVKLRCDRIDTNQPLAVLLRSLQSLLRGWTTYFRPGVSHATFHYLSHYSWQSVMRWLRRKHPKASRKRLRHRYCHGRWWPADGQVSLFDLATVTTTRYRYRGAKIPSPWPST
jgi:RNA-directed DNA polymerase